MDILFKRYIEKHIQSNPLINHPVSDDLKLIVIIPAFNEPEISDTLLSFYQCKAATYKTEIIVLINYGEKVTDLEKEDNENNYKKVQKWIVNHSNEKLSFYCAIAKNLPNKYAGAGFARKILMDEAIRRFATINNHNGIIASADADTTVTDNYLADIQKHFMADKKINCAIFNFEHPINNLPNPLLKNAIIQYELFLRYFKQALSYTGFPYSHHTIGSCFAVNAKSYIKQGGMNRRKGGEDFYFLHKVFPLGGIKEINSITVYPSSRISNRVPFGTGPSLHKIINEGTFFTYQPCFFTYLKEFFDIMPNLFKCNKKDINNIYEKLDESLRNFISKEAFISHITEINQNTSSESSFTQRFFSWIDAFAIIKYLNYTHTTVKRISIKNAAMGLLQIHGFRLANISDEDLLHIMRARDISQKPTLHQPQ